MDENTPTKIVKDHEEELLAWHKKKTERTMKIAVSLLISAFAFTLWFLLTHD